MGISLQQLSNSINKVMAKVTALDCVIKNTLDTHKDNTDIHVTSEDKTKWESVWNTQMANSALLIPN